MIDDSERLDAALNRRHIGASLDDVQEPVRALVQLAGEVASAFGGFRLSAADHDRLYAESLLRLEGAMRRQRHVWNRLHVGARGAAFGGGAAVALAAAAVGIAVINHRHHQRQLHAAA